MTGSDVLAVLPEILVTATACLVLLVDASLDRLSARLWLPIVTVLGLIGAILSAPFTVTSDTASGAFRFIAAFTVFFRLLFRTLPPS